MAKRLTERLILLITKYLKLVIDYENISSEQVLALLGALGLDGPQRPRWKRRGFCLLLRPLHLHPLSATGAHVGEQFPPADEDVVMAAVRAVVGCDGISRLVISGWLRRIFAALVHIQSSDIHLLAALAAGVDEDL